MTLIENWSSEFSSNSVKSKSIPLLQKSSRNSRIMDISQRDARMQMGSLTETLRHIPFSLTYSEILRSRIR